MDGSRRTALMLTVTYGNVRCVNLLLQSGADPNLQDDKKKSALYYYILNQHTVYNYKEIIELLLIHKYNTLIRDEDEYAAIHYAVKNGYFDSIVQLLLHDGIDVNVSS